MAKDATVLMTRKRWGKYLLPAFLITALVAGWVWWVTGEMRLLAAPIGMLLLWWMLRATTAAEGDSLPTIQTTPGILTLLSFIGAAFLCAAVLWAFDSYVLGHPLSAPLKPYHVILFSPPLLILVAGGFLVDRVKNRAENQTVDDASK